MGLRLSFDRSPRKVALIGGAWLMMRPASSVEIGAAEAAARRKIKDAIEGAGALAEIGLAAPSAADLADGHYVLGLSRYLAGVSLAERLVTDWGGVFGENGKEIVFDPSLLPKLFLEDTVLRSFEMAAYTLKEALIAEGEGSAPSPSGSAAGAPNTAATANRRERRAAEASQEKTGSSARSSAGPKQPKA
jgi:hypothetical protein